MSTQMVLGSILFNNQVVAIIIAPGSVIGGGCATSLHGFRGITKFKKAYKDVVSLTLGLELIPKCNSYCKPRSPMLESKCQTSFGNLSSDIPQ